MLCAASRAAAPDPAAAHFHKDVQPLLERYCYDCHADGIKKGSVAFDEFKSDDAAVHSRELWWNVLKNLRAGVMPPAKKPGPTDAERRTLERWIKFEAFGLDPAAPDPGRVTLRRLNRVEYRNTVRDLMGIDYKAEEEFPPDDTGYGFDNIGDVLTVSPLLLEKYMQAAESIVASAVPATPRVVAERFIYGGEFKTVQAAPGAPGGPTGDKLSFYKEASVACGFKTDLAGEYHVTADLEFNSSFEFDPGKCKVVFKLDGKELAAQDFAWGAKKFHVERDEKWQPGEHRLTLELHPLLPAEKKINSIDLKISGVRVQGPIDPKHWVKAKNYERFFPRDAAPAGDAERQAYAREVLAGFVRKAFRRPADPRTLDRLTAIARATYTQPGKGFEQGIGQAMIAVLASPRFLYRVEDSLAPAAPTSAAPAKSPAGSPTGSSAGSSLVDEFALASRLSYFLWSTMPDEELLRLAERGELRRNQAAQVKRMLADPRSEALVQNFAGQWLEARDVEGVALNPRLILRRDGVELPKGNNNFDGEFRQLRTSMRRETEMYFAYVLREDRSTLDFLDSDYTFLNEKLAKHYGVPGVSGNEMRRVTLPKDSPRGGLLTQGTVLVVTSNPTRTSPVKRGQFILENLLGAPTPPPPPNIPDLEASEKGVKGHEPTLRETLEIHRQQPLCASCHNRMDPLGLSLENFNAFGVWRSKERGQTIDPAGKLVSGETFADVKELKKVLKEKYLTAFYRCLTEKLLTYALGRGLEYYDVETVDQIEARMESNGGKFSALLTGVIDSAPFQKRRNATAAPAKPAPVLKAQAD